jgi:hypothetical protein
VQAGGSGKKGTQMDKQIFDTRKAAQDEIIKMKGWIAKSVKIDTDNGQKWVIQCDGDKYLREDGYVR